MIIFQKIGSKLAHSLQHYPLVRGMLMYSVTWPVGSLIQQSFESKEYDYKRMLRFSLYGSLFVAPSLYGWMKLSCTIWPNNTLAFAFIKGFSEQLLYAPFATSSFFFIMTVLDGETIQNGIREVQEKLIPTWKVSACVWPVVQTVNYKFIPEKNRVIFIAICSLLWTVFLAFVKYKQQQEETLHVKDL